MTVADTTSFSLDGTNGAGSPAYAGGGMIAPLALAPSGARLAVTDASNASPVAITTATPHGLHTGDEVSIGNVQVNGADDPFTVTVTSATSFTLDGSTGAAAYAGGGLVKPLVLAPNSSPERCAHSGEGCLQPRLAHRHHDSGAALSPNRQQRTDQPRARKRAANGTFTITVTGPNTFTLNGSTGNGAWTSPAEW